MAEQTLEERRRLRDEQILARLREIEAEKAAQEAAAKSPPKPLWGAPEPPKVEQPKAEKPKPKAK